MYLDYFFFKFDDPHDITFKFGSTTLSSVPNFLKYLYEFDPISVRMSFIRIFGLRTHQSLHLSFSQNLTRTHIRNPWFHPTFGSKAERIRSIWFAGKLLKTKVFYGLVCIIHPTHWLKMRWHKVLCSLNLKCLLANIETVTKTTSASLQFTTWINVRVRVHDVHRLKQKGRCKCQLACHLAYVWCVFDT